MRKIVQLIIAVFLLINTAYAQHWELAPKIGYHNELSHEYERRHGFDIGLGGTYNFNKKFAVEADAMYSLVGGYSFVNVPIKAKYYIVRGLNIFAGPQFNFYLNDEPFFVMPGRREPLVPHHFLFAVMGGVGYKFENGYGISVSYNYNITESYVCDRDTSRFKNLQGIKITLAKYFKLGK